MDEFDPFLGRNRARKPHPAGTRYCACGLDRNGRTGAWHPDYLIPDTCPACGVAPVELKAVTA